MRAAALVTLATLGLVGCGSAATSSTQAPKTAIAPAPVAASVDAAKADEKSAPQTPEDALLARLDQMQKMEFLRMNNGRGATRPKVAPTEFEVASLPTVKLAGLPVVEVYKPNQATPPRPNPKLGPIDPEVQIAPWDPKDKVVAGAMRNVRLSLRDSEKDGAKGEGLSHLGLVEQLRRGPHGSARELVEHCGDNWANDRWVPIRYSRVQMKSDGVHAIVGDAVLDRVECAVHGIQRAETKTVALVPGGAMYGFRACGETCEARESLMVVMPRANGAAASSLGGDPVEQIGTFAIVELPIEHGGGGSVVANLTGPDVANWNRALAGVELLVSPSLTLIGVEVTQSVREKQPFAIAYVEAKDPPSPVADAPLAKPILQGIALQLLR
jgi:hypothetical protein